MVEETKDTKVLNMEEKMADKVEKMQQFLADNKIECFDVQKLEDERHTTIFRSRMEVKGQLLPMAVLMDDSVYVILQVQIAPQVVDEAKLAELAAAINNMNNNVRPFKFTVSDRGDFMLNACITAENNTFNPVLLNAIMGEALKFLEAQYANIMEVIWKK
ncbi:hypothetical protein [uncultured Phascolarctobacterium sp.]|uniref:hypothetical protein n=1 Tax=uncultured Phascolarctobacterium sp. TaxID=512296 RepID=UPI0025D38124|nr:hypothetical protein [uncultured Phascolarctobacterium sp.]